MEVYRIDDVPLIYAQLQEMKLQELIDQSIPTHGNWQGISLGNVLVIWLSYLISEGDHRLSPVESWVFQNLLWLQSLTGLSNLTSKDLTDDRLEQALDYLSEDSNWSSFASVFEANTLSIYDLDSETIRLDAAPMQGHHRIKPEGLFQKGYHKQHANLGQFKIMLASLDNKVNQFGYPLFHKVFSGEKADDILYYPVLKDCNDLFKGQGDHTGKLIVGDSKMGSKFLRHSITEMGHSYLVPLSKVQLSNEKRKELINNSLSDEFEQVYKNDKLVAKGFEVLREMNYTDKSEQNHNWKERLIFVLSSHYAKSQRIAFDKKMKSTQALLLELAVPKQGKVKIESKQTLILRIDEILKAKSLQDCLKVEVIEIILEKQKRKYGNLPARTEYITQFQIKVKIEEQVVEEKKKLMGWQVYACTENKEKLSLEQCVWKYRAQNQIEKRFDDLRNKIAPLIPIHLQKDNRVQALVHLLMIALKAIALMEYKVAKSLAEKKQKLDNIYPGNPKQATKNPTAKRILTAFKGISIVVFKKKTKKKVLIELTDISQNQKKIIKLMGFKSSIYKKLKQNIKFSFST